jgi:hypothetical protein
MHVDYHRQQDNETIETYERIPQLRFDRNAELLTHGC